ncbi:hypothetical protein RQP46_002261 [Phenoliferia psychrophenolica]
MSAIPPNELKTLRSLRKLVATHEQLSPPSEGEWSIRHADISEDDLKLLERLMQLLRTPAAKAQALEVLRPFLDAWEAELWPNAGLTSEVHDANWEQFQLLDVVRFKVISLLRHVEPSRIAEAETGSKQKLEERDPFVYLYAGVSLFYAGTDIAKAEEYLRLGLLHPGRIAPAPQGPVWGRAVLIRALRAQGKEEEANKDSVQVCEVQTVEGRLKAEENVLVRGKRNELSIGDSLDEWMNAAVLLLSTIVSSAFKASPDPPHNTLAKTHVLVIELVFHPLGTAALDHFDVRSAILVPHAIIGRLSNGAVLRAIQSMLANAAPSNDPQVDFPIMIQAFEKGKSSPVRTDPMLLRLSEFQLQNRAHDPEWERVLRGKRLH